MTSQLQALLILARRDFKGSPEGFAKCGAVGGAGSVGRPMIELAAAIFQPEGVDPKIREFIVPSVCKLIGGVNPWGPPGRASLTRLTRVVSQEFT